MSLEFTESRATMGGDSAIPSQALPLNVDRHKLWHLSSPILWASLDACMAFASMWLAFQLTPQLTPSSTSTLRAAGHITAATAGWLHAGVAFCLSYALGLSYYPNLRSRLRIVILTSPYVVLCVVSVLALIYFAFYLQIGRYIIAISAAVFWAASTVARLLWFERVRRSVHHVLVLGDSYVLGPLDRMLANSTFPIKVVARHVTPANDETRSPFSKLLEEGSIHEVLVHGNNTLNSELLLTAMDRGITVSTFDSFSERHFFKVPSEFLNPAWFFQIDLKRHHPFYTFSKRAMDVGLALLGGILTLPVVGIAVAFIKLTSKGPAFYSQIRAGEGQRPFRIWKLRSMRVDSEKHGAQWAKVKDPRVTFVGVILRKTRIDELPQFWNILVGDMSFVGPRPERPEFVEKLAVSIPYYRQRHLVKPGLTGWAQICYRYGASEEDAREKLSYDLYYLKNASWALDLQIMMQTVGAIAKGAR
jgi:exopolysaccharide biosynthesis polyprenyl glycosylphosphotransferase